MIEDWTEYRILFPIAHSIRIHIGGIWCKTDILLVDRKLTLITNIYFTKKIRNSTNFWNRSLIRLGEHDTRTDPDCQGNVCAPKVQDRNINRIISHNCFNKPAFHNDLAVIELEKPVEFNSKYVISVNFMVFILKTFIMET